jgi:hypothetical protein
MHEPNKLSAARFSSHFDDLTELIEEGQLLEAAAKKLIRQLESYTSKVGERMANLPS